MSWRPSAKKVEAVAREMTAADLLDAVGRAYAFCPTCRVWRRVRFRRLFDHERSVPLVSVRPTDAVCGLGRTPNEPQDGRRLPKPRGAAALGLQQHLERGGAYMRRRVDLATGLQAWTETLHVQLTVTVDARLRAAPLGDGLGFPLNDPSNFFHDGMMPPNCVASTKHSQVCTDCARTARAHPQTVRAHPCTLCTPRKGCAPASNRYERRGLMAVTVGFEPTIPFRV